MPDAPTRPVLHRGDLLGAALVAGVFAVAGVAIAVWIVTAPGASLRVVTDAASEGIARERSDVPPPGIDASRGYVVDASAPVVEEDAVVSQRTPHRRDASPDALRDGLVVEASSTVRREDAVAEATTLRMLQPRLCACGLVDGMRLVLRFGMDGKLDAIESIVGPAHHRCAMDVLAPHVRRAASACLRRSEFPLRCPRPQGARP